MRPRVRRRTSALSASRLRAITSRSAPRPHGRRTGVRPSGRPHVGWHTAMCPLVPLPVPRPAAVVVAPVTRERERDDRQAETRPVRIKGDPFALIDEGYAARIDPASVVVKRHVAPAPIVEASVHIERRPRIELRHQRVIPVGSGANVHGASGESALGAGETECAEQQRSERIDERAAAHHRSPVRLRAGAPIVGRNRKPLGEPMGRVAETRRPPDCALMPGGGLTGYCALPATGVARQNQKGWESDRWADELWRKRSQPVCGRRPGPSMVTVWQRSRRRLRSALVRAGVPRKSCQGGYGRFVLMSVGCRR